MTNGQITAEQLRQMTPEQIRELQKQNCIFCHIIAGRVQSRKIYEDEQVLGILDINPANPGHAILIPKEHFSIMPQMKDYDVGYIYVVAKHISNAMLRAIKCQGTNIFAANGIVAGQKAPHFMLHIIPRKDGDGLSGLGLERKDFPPEELEQLRAKIQKTLAELYDIKPRATEEEGESAPQKGDEQIHEEKYPDDEKETEKKVPDEEENDEHDSGSKPDSSDDSIDIDTLARLLHGGG